VLRFFLRRKVPPRLYTWFYFVNRDFQLRMVLLGFRCSSMSFAGVIRSNAFDKVYHMEKLRQVNKINLLYFINYYTQSYEWKIYYLKNIPVNTKTKKKAIFLLHGVGSNEIDLFNLKSYFPDFHIFSLRGIHSYWSTWYAWYKVDFSSGEAIYNWENVKVDIKNVAEIIMNIQEEYEISTRDSYILGFSQGAIICYALAILSPEIIWGIICLSWRILIELHWIEKRMKDVKVFIGHWMMDSVIKIEESEKAEKFLKGHTDMITRKNYPIGHTISKEEIQDIILFLE